MRYVIWTNSDEAPGAAKGGRVLEAAIALPDNGRTLGSSTPAQSSPQALPRQQPDYGGLGLVGSQMKPPPARAACPPLGKELEPRAL